MAKSNIYWYRLYIMGNQTKHQPCHQPASSSSTTTKKIENFKKKEIRSPPLVFSFISIRRNHLIGKGLHPLSLVYGNGPILTRILMLISVYKIEPWEFQKDNNHDGAFALANSYDSYTHSFQSAFVFCIVFGIFSVASAPTSDWCLRLCNPKWSLFGGNFSEGRAGGHTDRGPVSDFSAAGISHLIHFKE